MDLIQQGLQNKNIRFEEGGKYIVYSWQEKRRNYDNPEEKVQADAFLRLVDQAFKALLLFLTDKQGAYLDVDDLLLLHFFRRRHEVPWKELREVYPYDDRRLREKLASLETTLLMLEHSGTGRGTIYRLSRRASAILNEGATYDMTRRLDREAIKIRILTLLKDRPLRNAEIRAFTDLERQQVTAILKDLESEGQVSLAGKGAGARWHLAKGK